MSKTSGNINLVLLACRQQNTGPFPQKRGADPYVNGDVQCFAFNDAAKLRLRMLQLIVKTAERSLDRAGVVVLNKNVVDSQLGQTGTVVGLEKKASLVTEHLGAQFPDSRQTGFDSLHLLILSGAQRSGSKGITHPIGAWKERRMPAKSCRVSHSIFHNMAVLSGTDTVKPTLVVLVPVDCVA